MPVLPARQITPAVGPAPSAKIFPFCSYANQFIHASVSPGKRGGSRSSRNARWDAVDADGAIDVRARKRTVKSCGSDVAVLALRPGEAKLLWDNGGKKAVLREEHEVSRKAIAQGRPGCSRCTCMLVCTFCYAQTAHETSGAASTRSSLRPLTRGREVASKPRAHRAARSRPHN